MTSFKREDYTEDEQRLLDAEGFFDDEDNSPPEEVIVGTEELPSLSVRKKARTSHVESEEYTKELDLEAEHKLKVKDQEYETGRIANDPSEGLLGAFKRKLIDPAYWESTLQNLNEPTRMTGSAVVGIAKGAEEIAQTLGAPDNALNLPKPKDTGEGLIQGTGQQLPTFLGALKGLNYVDKYTDVLKGRSTLKSALAGAITDFTTLDPKDPTVVDLLFVFDIISKDSTLGALLKETLGQNDKDSEGYARSKQALLGLLFGGMIDLTIQGSKAAKNAVVNRKEAKEFNKPIALEAKTDPPPPPPPASPSVKADDPIVSQAKEQIESEKLDESLVEASGGTAISRKTISTPTRALIDSDKIKGRVLHYGAGQSGKTLSKKGAPIKENPDRKALKEVADETVDYDIHHSPETEGSLGKQDFDQVVSNFVLNVIPKSSTKGGREGALKNIADSVKDDGEVFITVRGTGDVPSNIKGSRGYDSKISKGWKPHKDGWLVPNKGFQRGYSVKELKEELLEFFDEVEVISSSSAAPMVVGRKPKRTGEVNPELKEDTKKVIDGFSEFVDEVHATGSPEQKAKLEEALPGMKAAQKERKNKEAGEGVQDDHIWENLDETKQQEIVNMVIKFSKKQNLMQDINLNEINSMNFNKLLEGDDVKNVLQGISEKANIADLVKTKIATEDFDTISGIKKLQELTGLGEGQAGTILQEQANNVRNAIKFVAVARVMGVATLKQADAAFERFAATSNKADYNRALQFTRLTTEMLGAGGELSKASSDLLRAHKKLIDNADHLSEYKAFLTKELEVDPVIAVTTAKRMGIKNTIDKLQVETKSKLTGQRKHTRASVTKQIENRIKSLEKQLEADPNAPKKPKKAPVTSKRIRELEGQLKVKKAKLKAAKKELKNKTKLSKEQNAIRKEFESLSKKIREAKNRKAKTPKQQKLKTVDISKLKAELKRVRAKYKAEVPESYKTQKEIEKLSKEYNELLLIRDPDKAPKPKEKGTPRVRTERELNLIEKIRRQKFRLNMLKGDNLKKDDLIGIIKREDLETSVDILQNESLKQLKGRVNYLTKSAVARTKDAALQIYINGLLSTLKTFAVNGVGNSSAIVFNMAETFYAGATAGGVVTTREARELASGYMEQLSSLSDLWSLFKKGMDIEGSGAVKTDYGRVYDSAITKENWGQYGVLGQGLDFAANIVDFPKRLMLASDEVFKGVTYGAEKRRLSWRKAWQEADGDLDAAEELYKDILSDFEAHPDLVELADISKAKNTYTNKLPSYLSQDTFGNPTVKKGLALTIKDALDLDPTGIVRIHVPFFQTPANLLSYQFERTPFLNKIHRGLQEELSESAPDHVRELAEARVSMSNLVFGSMFTYAMAGNITGPPPTDAKLRANMEAAMGGKHWNSVHIAGEWRQYNKFDPVGGLFLTAAILASLGKNSFRVSTETDAADVGDEKFDKFVEVLLSGVEGLSTIITDRHYFKTISDTLHTLTGGSETQVKDLLAKTAGGYNPAASFYSSARRNILMKGNNPRKTIKDSRQEVNSLSDVWREITDVATAAYDKVTPGRGSNVVDINMVGEPKLWPGLTYQSEMGLLERLTNLTSSYTNILPGITPSKSILMQKIAQLEMTVKQPSDVKRIAGVLLNNEEREFFMAEFTKLNKLADIKRHGIVANSWFNELPEGIQRDMITTFLSDNESAAKRLTSVSFKRLIDHETIRARQEQQSLTAPVVPKGFQAPGQQQYLQSLLGQQ